MVDPERAGKVVSPFPLSIEAIKDVQRELENGSAAVHLSVLNGLKIENPNFAGAMRILSDAPEFDPSSQRHMNGLFTGFLNTYRILQTEARLRGGVLPNLTVETLQEVCDEVNRTQLSEHYPEADVWEVFIGLSISNLRSSDPNFFDYLKAFKDPTLEVGDDIEWYLISATSVFVYELIKKQLANDGIWVASGSQN